jgi:hypothetical protein
VPLRLLGTRALLFRPVEMLLKVCTLTPYLAVLVHLCQSCECEQEQNMITTPAGAKRYHRQNCWGRRPQRILVLTSWKSSVIFVSRAIHQREKAEPNMQQESLQYQTWLHHWHHWQRLVWWASIAWIVPVCALVDVVPVRVWGQYECVPLAVTSVSVAVALSISFVRITYRMVSCQ